ncbi:MAG TPA: hypothetical protein VLU96_10460 [Gaiellaceae bacterium]|nr:hypothetical protein [Gaiellaceae bacterium]
MPGVDGELSVPAQLDPGEGAVAADSAAAATLVGIAPSAAAGISGMAVLGRLKPVEPLVLANARAL